MLRNNPEFKYIKKALEDEAWLLGEKLGHFISVDDERVVLRVAEIINEMGFGQWMREQIIKENNNIELEDISGENKREK